MAINFKTALGIHEPALKFRAQRAEVIANNLANADTPHFKARDVDFQKVFADTINAQSMGLKLATTNPQHRIRGNFAGMDGDLLYRIPVQPSIDGNTVDEHVENAQFMENAMDFQASFTFLNSRFKGLLSAIRGE